MGLYLVPENFFAQASLAVSPAAVSTLPETNLQAQGRDVWRSASLIPQVFTGSWGGNMRIITMFGVWPSTEGSSLIGSQWRLELFRDAALTTSIFDQTYNFFTPTGAAWGSFTGWGVDPWGVETGDRTCRLAPLVKYFAAVYASSYRITVSDLHYVDTPYFEGRRIWLGNYVQAPYNAAVGAAPAWMSSSDGKRTYGGALRRVTRARWRELRFETIVTEEADREAWSDLMYLCDPAREIVVSLYPGDATPRRERDFTVIGSLEKLSPMPITSPDLHTLQLAAVES
jgi:hypothetical protein